MQPVLFLCLMLMSSLAFSTDYYVAANGSDGNPGTRAAPWRSVSKVNSVGLAPGDSVFFRRGDTFSGELSITESGADWGPITFDAYGSGKAPELTNPYGHCVTMWDGYDYITIQNLAIGYCNASGIAVWTRSPAVGFTVQSNTIDDSGTGIYICGVQDVIIHDNVIRNQRREHGVYIDGSCALYGAPLDNVEVSQNAISDVRDMGIQVNANGSGMATNVRIHDNTIDGAIAGINDLGMEYGHVHDNVFTNVQAGVYVDCDRGAGCEPNAPSGTVYEYNTFDARVVCMDVYSPLGTPTVGAFQDNLCIASQGLINYERPAIPTGGNVCIGNNGDHDTACTIGDASMLAD